MAQLESMNVFGLLGSLCAGTAAYQLSKASMLLITSRSADDTEGSDQKELRYRRLRHTSNVFSIFERAILPLAQALEPYTADWDSAQYSKALPIRFVRLLARLTFGTPSKVVRAIDILAIDQPWKLSELIGAGLLVATACSLGTGVLLFRSMSGIVLCLLMSLLFLASYRYWIYTFLKKAKEKQRNVLQLLPHAVDTITMVMQSGGTFLVGIESVIKDFPNHPLGMELQRMRGRLMRGQTTREAIEATAKAVRLPEFDDVARILARIHDHGAPSTDSFARLARQMRLAHLRRMEEQVGQAESKMSLPTMLVLFSCMLICLGPFLLTLGDIKLFN